MKKLLLLMSVALLTVVGCSDDEVINGPNGTIVGFANAGFSKSYLNDVDDADLAVPLSLISYANEQYPTQDISLTWEVVPSTAADAAVAGVDYDLPAGGGGVATIAAGKSTASFNINVHPNVLEPEAPKKLTLKITSATNSIVGKQYEKIVITLRGICVSSIQGMYDLSVSRLGTTTVYSLPGETINKVNGTVSQYRSDSAGPYNTRGLVSANAQMNGVGITFDDTCGNISLYKNPDWADNGGDTGIPAGTAQNLGPYYNPVYQTAAQAANSFVNDVTGVITIEYSIWFAAGTNTYRGTYTPL